MSNVDLLYYNPHSIIANQYMYDDNYVCYSSQIGYEAHTQKTCFVSLKTQLKPGQYIQIYN